MHKFSLLAFLLIFSIAFCEEEYDKSIHLSGDYGEWRCNKGVVKLKIDGFIKSRSDQVRLYFELSSGQNRVEDPFETMTISADFLDEMASALISGKSVESRGKFKIQVEGDYSTIQVDVNGVWGFEMKLLKKDSIAIGARVQEVGKIMSKITRSPK